MGECLDKCGTYNYFINANTENSSKEEVVVRFVTPNKLYKKHLFIFGNCVLYVYCTFLELNKRKGQSILMVVKSQK